LAFLPFSKFINYKYICTSLFLLAKKIVWYIVDDIILKWVLQPIWMWLKPGSFKSFLMHQCKETLRLLSKSGLMFTDGATYKHVGAHACTKFWGIFYI
jgi:hypothetical protein